MNLTNPVGPPEVRFVCALHGCEKSAPHCLSTANRDLSSLRVKSTTRHAFLKGMYSPFILWFRRCHKIFNALFNPETSNLIQSFKGCGEHAMNCPKVRNCLYAKMVTHLTAQLLRKIVSHGIYKACVRIHSLSSLLLTDSQCDRSLKGSYIGTGLGTNDPVLCTNT